MSSQKRKSKFLFLLFILSLTICYATELEDELMIGDVNEIKEIYKERNSIEGLGQTEVVFDFIGVEEEKVEESKRSLQSVSMANLQCIGQPMKKDEIRLKRGFNIISIPISLRNRSPVWLCEQIDCVVISTYVNRRWLFYSPRVPIHISSLKEINETIGLEVIVRKNTKFPINASMREIAVDHLKGWNLVGYPSLKETPIEDIYDISKINLILMYDGKWKFYRPGRRRNSFTSLKPGFGYWVRAKEPFSITYNEGQENNAPVVDFIEILPDDSSDPGTQVMPNANHAKEVRINAEITDEDGVGDIVSVEAMTPKGGITLEKQTDIDHNTANFSGSFDMDYHDLPAVYDIVVVASDGEDTVNETEDFEYLELVALELDTANLDFGVLADMQIGNISGDEDMSTDFPTIKNVGNSVIDAEISGTDLVYSNWEITVDNIEYRLDGEYRILSETITEIDLDLQLDETQRMDLSLFIPNGTTPGTYGGSITLSAK